MPNKTKHRIRRNIKKSTKKQYNNKRKTIRKNHGGRYIDSGAYGHVYAEPRLLCDDEELSILRDKDSAPYKEVSKIFSDNDEALKEYTAVEHLKNIISEEDLLELHKYCVFPIRQCIVKENILRNAPYNSEMWRKNKKNEYNSRILNRDGGLNGYEDMITYAQGGDNLEEIFNEISNENDCIVCLTKLLSILKGIQILQKYNIIHGDLKSPNCIEIDNTFKMIDMAEAKEILSSNNSNNLPTAFGYYTLPSISVYTVFFDDKQMNELNVEPDQKFKIDQSILKRLYIIHKNFNDSQFYTTINSELRECFRDIDIGFDQDTLTKIRDIGNELISQKTFGIIDSIENDYDEFNDMLKIIRHIHDNGMDNSKIGSMNAFFAKFNTIFTSFESEEEMKLDLFKRIDIYSFGIMVLYVIKQYIVLIRKSKSVTYAKLDYIRELYIFVNICCNQREHVVNINELVILYDGILKIISKVQREQTNNIMSLFRRFFYYN